MADTWLHWGNILLMWERSLGPLLTTWILDLSEGWMWRFSEPGWICPNSVGTKQPHWIPDRKCGEQIGEGTSAWAITPPSSLFLWEEWMNSLKEIKPALFVLTTVLEINMGKHGKWMSGSLITLKYEWKVQQSEPEAPSYTLSFL